MVLNWYAVHELVTNLQALTKAKYVYFHIYFQKELRRINKQFENFCFNGKLQDIKLILYIEPTKMGRFRQSQTLANLESIKE
jgi:hypothetical protein